MSTDLLRPADKREDTNFDRIWRYYYDPAEIQLTDLQKKLAKRWDNIWKLLGGFLVDAQVIKKHLKDFPDICERTARNDIRNAKALFGDPANMNRMADRQRLNVFIIKGLKKSYKAGDWSAYARLIDQYRKNNLLHLDDQESIEDLLQHFTPHTFEFSVEDPEVLKQKAEELMEGVPVIDADYTIVKDED